MAQANDQLLERDGHPIAGDLSRESIGYGKDAKKLRKSRPRQSAKLRFLSGQ